MDENFKENRLQSVLKNQLGSVLKNEVKTGLTKSVLKNRLNIGIRIEYKSSSDYRFWIFLKYYFW